MKPVVCLLLSLVLAAGGCDIWGTSSRLIKDGPDGSPQDGTSQDVDGLNGQDGGDTGADIVGDGAGGDGGPSCNIGGEFFVVATLNQRPFTVPERLTAASFDGDQTLDLAIVDSASKAVSVIRGLNESGGVVSFEGAQVVSFNSEPITALGVFDAGAEGERDNRQDLAAVTMKSTEPPPLMRLYARKNYNNPVAFEDFNNFPVDLGQMYGRVHLLVGRFDNNESQDLLINITYMGAMNKLYLWEQNTLVAFSGQISLGPMEVSFVRDLDRDGREDIVFVENSGMGNPDQNKKLKLAFGGKTVSDGFFGLRDAFILDNLYYRDSWAADFNGDGFDDLALAVSTNEPNKTQIRFYAGLSLNGIFKGFASDFSEVTVETDLVRLAADDLNGDGRAELLVGDRNGAYVLLLHNTAVDLSISMAQAFSVKTCTASGQKVKDLVVASMFGLSHPGFIVACGDASAGEVYFVLNRCGR